MPETEKIGKDCRSQSLFISIIVILGIGVITFGYLYYQQIKLTEIQIAEVIETTKAKESVKAELGLLLTQYDSLMTDNDSINYMLEEEQIKIKGLIKNINNNKSKIRSYKKELSTLRDVMRSYIVQIDSLNTKNKFLTAENIEVKLKFKEERKAKKLLEEKAKNLEEKVETASTLSAKLVNIEVLKKRGRKTRIADKVIKIKICFQLPENSIAVSEDKEIFVRIARPDELVMAESEYNLFDFEGKQIVYSAMRVIEYNNISNNDVCIFCDNQESLIPGTYTVDIFSEGKIIGTSTFVLR